MSTIEAKRTNNFEIKDLEVGNGTRNGDGHGRDCIDNRGSNDNVVAGRGAHCD
jgi:hypothetical protein